jgi:hypothetical protein
MDWEEPEQQNHRGGDAFVNPDWQQPEQQNHRGGDAFVNPDWQQPEQQNHRGGDAFVNPDWQQPEQQNHRGGDPFVNPDLQQPEQQNHRGGGAYENPDRQNQVIEEQEPSPPSHVPDNNHNARPIVRPHPNPKPFVRPTPRPTPQPQPHAQPIHNPHQIRPQPPGNVNNFPAENRSLRPPGNPPPLPGLPPSYGALQWKNKIQVSPPQYNYNRMIQDAPMPNISSSNRSIDSDEAHEIFINWAESCCCYGKSCARESTITQCVPSYGVQVAHKK